MHSLSDGILREYVKESENGLYRCFELVSHFFGAVQQAFSSDWVGHTPRTSRLVHGAGIISMGFVMDELVATTELISQDAFRERLEILRPICAWSAGNWNFGPGDLRKWNDLQVLPKDYLQLTDFFIRELRSTRCSVQALRKPT
jgi:hypothetical protein